MNVKTKINVKGMHCKSCEMLITDSLQELPGIQKVKVDHTKGVVDVSFDEHKINTDIIKKVIVKEGYKVEGD